MLRRKGWHVVPWRRWPILVVMLLVLNWRWLRTIGFRILIAIVVLVPSGRIRRLKQLIERGCWSGGLRYTQSGHGVSLLRKHCTRWSRHSHHLFGVTMPELSKTVGLSVAVGMMLLLFWGRLMVTEIVPEASGRRRRITVLVGRCLFEIVSFCHVTVPGRLITVVLSTVRRAAAVAATHVLVTVVIDRHLLLFTFGRFGRQATAAAAAAHGRPAFVAAVLEAAGHVQRPAVLVAIVHVDARLVFRVRSSHVRRRYWQQNVCQHPAAATRQRQRT